MPLPSASHWKVRPLFSGSVVPLASKVVATSGTGASGLVVSVITGRALTTTVVLGVSGEPAPAVTRSCTLFDPAVGKDADAVCPLAVAPPGNVHTHVVLPPHVTPVAVKFTAWLGATAPPGAREIPAAALATE